MREDPGMWDYFESFGQVPEESPSLIVQAMQYKKLTLSPGVEWDISKTIQDVEKETYKELLSEYQDVFAWSNTDLTGIAPEYGEHKIES
jgi:hypothetical protein